MSNENSAKETPSITASAFTSALSQAANGVSVVTTTHDDIDAGLTVSSMCSVCADPALLLICVNSDNEFCEMAMHSGRFAVNILPSSCVELAMVFAGLGFKLSVVPFHFWTADVYDGAPAPITGFLASVAKAAVFVVLLRLFLDADLFRYHTLVELTGLMAILGMVAGNLLALLQTNIKRMLAYSSIAHIGYLLVIFMVSMDTTNRALAAEAASFYLIR